jgi:hypothetical protein
MVKECKVLMNNDAVTVFQFDDEKVQVPAIGRKAKTVKVVAENGLFKVVDDDYKEQPKKVEEDKPEKQVKKTIAKEEKIQKKTEKFDADEE